MSLRPGWQLPGLSWYSWSWQVISRRRGQVFTDVVFRQAPGFIPALGSFPRDAATWFCQRGGRPRLVLGHGRAEAHRSVMSDCPVTFCAEV